MRYERKYEIEKNYNLCFTNAILTNGFHEIYSSRIVNSLYYDDAEFLLFSDSEDGINDRKKIRLRFYNSNFEDVNIEQKIKDGELNKKISRNIKQNDKERDKKLNFYDSNNKLNFIYVPKSVNQHFLPKTFIIYKRRYFLSENKELRITIDENIFFQKVIGIDDEFFTSSKRLHMNSIIEFKYSVNHNPLNYFNQDIFNIFNLTLTKSSKYCKSIYSLYN